MKVQLAFYVNDKGKTDNKRFWKKLVSCNNDDDDERTCGKS